MARKSLVGVGFATFACVLLASGAWAQQASGIAGVVRDTSGAVLPGVTVQAASPALIEKVRTVFTDGEGRYGVVDLRPGTYSVTFTLTGFRTLVREGIELGAGFTATVNAELPLGTVEETVTVAGAAPLVDVQAVREQRTLAQRELQALPAANFGVQTLVQVMPGFKGSALGITAGGTQDSWDVQGDTTLYHGKPGTRASFNGFRNQYAVADGCGTGYVTNSDTIQELQLEVSGMGAEAGSGSIMLNAIPKDGGNTFAGTLHGKYSNSAMHASNLDDHLRSLGLTTPRKVQNVYRASGTFGGPIIEDRLWFFGAVARWGMRVRQPGAFFNRLQGTNFHEFDRSRPADDFDWNRSHAGRLTWQALKKHRIGFFGDLQKNCQCTIRFTGQDAIESRTGWDSWPSGIVQTTWTAPLTNRLLLEAGQSWLQHTWVNFPQPGVTRDDRSILEASTNFRYQAPVALIEPIARTGRGEQRFTLSYVTGSHNFKAGVTTGQAFSDNSLTTPGPQGDGTSWIFFNGQPILILYLTQPFFQQERMNLELGLFAQDSWTIDRLTIHLGARMDYINAGYPAAELPAGAFVPARRVEKRTGLPEWTDVHPRFGAVYDLFGNARTALKVSFGRYAGLSGMDFARQGHPSVSSVNTAIRAWNDANRNFVPDCDLANFVQNGECGPISNSNFGKFDPNAIQFSDNLTQKNREYTWDFLTEVQHELFKGLSVSMAYNHNWSRNFVVVDNLLVGPEDYDHYCITAPVDAQLPGGGGYQVCGLYDIKPEKFGQARTMITVDSEFGKQTRVWNGFTFSVDGRLRHGISVGGGLDVGKQVDNHCVTVDVPNQPLTLGPGSLGPGIVALPGGPFCKIVEPWSGLLDFRMRGSVPLPGGFTAGAVYKDLPGVPINAEFVATNADVAPSLGRNLAGGTQTVIVPLYAPNSRYAKRFVQVDLRLSRSINLGGPRLEASVDVFNALNSNSIVSQVDRYGPRWQFPINFIDGRLLQLTAQLFF